MRRNLSNCSRNQGSISLDIRTKGLISITLENYSLRVDWCCLKTLNGFLSTRKLKLLRRSDQKLTDRGYDFGYLMKTLTNEPLPQDEDDFFRLLFIWFPTLYDIKHVIRSCKPLKGGLQEIAESLGVRLLSYHVSCHLSEERVWI
jgi:hypothetical protein